MQLRSLFKVLGLLVGIALLVTLAAACGAAPTPETVIQTVEVEKVVTVEVEKQVEVEKVVTVEVEKQVEVEKVVTVEVVKEVEVAAEAAAPEDNPYRPNNLFDAVEDLKAGLHRRHLLGH
ncbi:MAG: hypothetical protein HYR94_24820 [Chloroflexi bacterium]|nr:hypothetical protein [Chloroflexota bacterium]